MTGYERKDTNDVQVALCASLYWGLLSLCPISCSFLGWWITTEKPGGCKLITDKTGAWKLIEWMAEVLEFRVRRRV